METGLNKAASYEAAFFMHFLRPEIAISPLQGANLNILGHTLN